MVKRVMSVFMSCCFFIEPVLGLTSLWAAFERWDPEEQTWALDEASNPHVDAMGEEETPNGSVVNVGVHGSTAKASRSN